MKHISLFSCTVIVSMIAMILFCIELPLDPGENPDNAGIHFFCENRNPSVYQGSSLKVGFEIVLEKHISSIVLGSSCGTLDTLILPSGVKERDTIFIHPVFNCEKACTLTATAALVKSEVRKYDTLIVYILSKDTPIDTSRIKKDIEPSKVDAPSSLIAGKADTLLFAVDNSNRIDKIAMQLVTVDGKPLDPNIFTVLPSGKDSILIAVAPTATGSTGTVKIGITTNNGTVTTTSWYSVTFVEQENALWNTSELSLNATEGKKLEHNLNSFLTESDGVSFTTNVGTIEGTIWKWTPAYGADASTTATIKASKGEKSMDLTLKITVTPGDFSVPELSLVDKSLDGSKVRSSQITVACTAKDSGAGVGSVTFTLGSQSVKASQQSGDTWSGVVSGLKNGVPSEITVTAIDKSMKKNSTTINFTVTNDSTVLNGKAPVITTNLKETLKVNEGEALMLMVEASATPEPTYQWYKDNTSLEGKTTAEFSKTAATAEDAGVYHVVVSNSVGDISSMKTTVTVAAKVKITVNPEPASAKEGESVSFTVKASGEKELKYQWFKSGEAIFGATSETYKINTVTPSDDGKKYSCTVSNSFSEATSTAAMLTVSATPVYTVKFDLDGGSPAIDPQSVKQGEMATEPSVKPTKSGFEFVGWYPSNTATTPFNFNTVITAGTTIVAKWVQLFTLTYSVNGGMGSVPQPEIYKSGETVTIKDTGSISKAGNRCLGWGDGKKTYNRGDQYQITGNVTLYAVWSPITYTVKFIPNNGSTVPSQTVQIGGKATEPAKPSKTGYEFAGWYTSVNPTIPFNFSTQTITADLELIAIWNPKMYTVSFNSNGGSTVQSQSVQSGGRATEPAAPTKSGNKFAGWYTSSSLTTSFNFSTQTITADCELFAKWTVDNITISLICADGNTMLDTTIASGTQITLPPSGCTVVCFDFMGWSTNPNAAAPMYKDQHTLTPTSSLKLYAVMSPITISVRYFADDGSGFMPEEEKLCGEKFTVSECKFTPPAGKTFSRWSGPRGIFRMPGDILTAGPIEYHQNYMEFHAIWQ